MRRIIVFVLTTFLPVLSQSLNAQDMVKVNNPGFEISAGNNGPENWYADSTNISLDKEVFSSGSASLKVESIEPRSSTVQSEDIMLSVGKLYKLSARVRTENAYTDGNKRYPTPVAACISMNSFPFTNHSPALGGSTEWQSIEVLFIATQKKDRICLNLGYNGPASGKVWFDDIKLVEVQDISEYIPPQSIKWYEDAFCFEDKGWKFVHIEGKPYSRGIQYGYLLADEIKDFISKLAINKNNSNPQAGWNEIRFAADAMMLRKYDEEYLTEMKGIADGINKTGVNLFNRPVDLIDIVAVNSAIDISYSADALQVTPNPLTGKSFLAAEDELALQDRLHKCSSFLASKSATTDNRIVFGQMFMWNGYTGNNWNVIVDVVPTEGNRLVYETFPGGIHSGADFYINGAGIMIGETTVNQTPFNPDGTPQSNRIRKAAQYAQSIDDVVKILTTKNNGLYTNDWLIGDTKTDEIAILVLGTHKYKLWRSSENDFYGGQKDWYWSDNNNKSLDVRKEYVANNENAPYDIIFRPVNRDIEFTNFYKNEYGKIDAGAAVDILATSPINRPHACDGKVTTSEMAEKMVFMAHFGKVTMREKFVGENGRIPDLPGAIPHLSLGYSVISPVLFSEKLKELRHREIVSVKDELPAKTDSIDDVYSFDKEQLWNNTVYPASEKENWYVSGTAAYRNMLNAMPSSLSKSMTYVKDELSELNNRLLYTVAREGTLAPVNAVTSYNMYKHYQIPRIRGTFLLHQLRLMLGNRNFSRVMKEIHSSYAGKELSNSVLIDHLNRITGKKLDEFVKQWIERESLPVPEVTTNKTKNASDWTVDIKVTQKGMPYHFFTTVMVETEKEQVWRLVEIKGNNSNVRLGIAGEPIKVVFNAGNDIPVNKKNYFTFSNFTDDFSNSIIVYGTSRQTDANHTLALRFSQMAADRFTEILLPVRKDSEVSEKELAERDIVLLGSPSDNMIMDKVLKKLDVKWGKNYFEWQGRNYGSSDDGLFVAFPNPYNSSRTVYLFISNSALELYNMTKTLYKMPVWALFKKDQIVMKGYLD